LSLLKSTRIEKLERIEGSRTKHTRKKMINESSFFVKYIFALEKNVRTLSGDTPLPPVRKRVYVLRTLWMAP